MTVFISILVVISIVGTSIDLFSQFKEYYNTTLDRPEKNIYAGELKSVADENVKEVSSQPLI